MFKNLSNTALVEKERVGGTCLNVGCIPTKSLATAAELLLRARRAGEFGLSIPQATVDLPGLMAYKQTTVNQLVAGVEQLLKARRITLLRGEGRLTKPNQLSVDNANGGGHDILAKHIILAPGSITANPPITGSQLPGVMTSTEALDIENIPTHLVIVGGGVIGLEFACIYEALGSKVTVLELTPTILPGATDEVIAKRLLLMLRRRGMEVQTEASVQGIERVGEAFRVVVALAGAKTEINCDGVLVATDRWPNTNGMGFVEAGLRLDGRAIGVDGRLATNLPNVWAVGDAIGGWMLAHKAMVDGRVAAENATGGQREVDYRSVPSVIFTRPEVASVGLTEAQARSSGAEVKVSQFPFSANPRARILGEHARAGSSEKHG